MQISKRVKNGWTPREENESKKVCDECGAKLWKGPGKKNYYCDAIHARATVYETDGRVMMIAPNNLKTFTLKELQSVVGGYIQILELPESNEIMIINEEGKLNGLDKNDLATAVWKKAYPIDQFPFNNDELVVGTAMVCTSEMVQ